MNKENVSEKPLDSTDLLSQWKFTAKKEYLFWSALETAEIIYYDFEKDLIAVPYGEDYRTVPVEIVVARLTGYQSVQPIAAMSSIFWFGKEVAVVRWEKYLTKEYLDTLIQEAKEVFREWLSNSLAIEEKHLNFT